MSGKQPDESVSDAEAERRATDALRRALTTPYKPQREIRVGRAPVKKKRTIKKTPGVP